MNWGIQALGAFNDPKAYQNMDYILISHGKNSSLITDTKNPLTWRFSDNDKSVYEFIEKNVPKGKKVMVLCCETDGIRTVSYTHLDVYKRQSMIHRRKLLLRNKLSQKVLVTRLWTQIKTPML